MPPTISLTEKYRPAELAGFAGLTTAKRLLSSLRDAPFESAWLLVGDSGTGKTTMAMALAAEMGAEVHHIASRECDLETVQRTVDACWYIPFSGGWHLVIVDEADQMTKPAQLAFLSKLDSTARPPKTIFIFTANETKGFEPRFTSRCRTVWFQGSVHAAEGEAFLRSVWHKETGNGDHMDFGAILERNGYNLRSCLNDLELELMAPGAVPMPAKAPVHITAATAARRSKKQAAPAYEAANSSLQWLFGSK